MGKRGGLDENSEKEIVLNCKLHGITKHTKFKAGKSKSGNQTFRYRCKKCQIEAVEKRRKKLKLLAVNYKGGKCEKCNYNKYIGALEFHHVNPKEKEFNISHDGCTYSWKRVKKELDKCILVCSNCHRELHSTVP